MRRPILLVHSLFSLIPCLFLLSCDEALNVSDLDVKPVNVMVQRISSARDSLVSDSVMAIVRGLFQRNNLTLENLQVYRFENDWLGLGITRCHQFHDGLVIFDENLIFQFDTQGVYSGITGSMITDVPVDTMPQVTPGAAGRFFCRAVEADPWYRDSLSDFVDRGLTAELGFYSVKPGLGSSSPKRFGLAWKIRPAGAKEYPYVCVRADAAELLGYVNGVIVG